MIHLKKSVADSIGRDDGGWNKQKDEEKKNDLPEEEEEEEEEETAWRRRKWYVRVGSPDQKKNPLIEWTRTNVSSLMLWISTWTLRGNRQNDYFPPLEL